MHGGQYPSKLVEPMYFYPISPKHTPMTYGPSSFIGKELAPVQKFAVTCPREREREREREKKQKQSCTGQVGIAYPWHCLMFAPTIGFFRGHRGEENRSKQTNEPKSQCSTHGLRKRSREESSRRCKDNASPPLAKIQIPCEPI